MQVTPIKRISVSEHIFQDLKQKIISGELKPSDKLPSENELCKLYGVSRTTIRQALLNLQSLDLIETKFGEGSFVKSINAKPIMNPLLTHTFLNKKSLTEIIEFRQLIEPNVAYIACKKATEKDVINLQNIYFQMEKNKLNLSEFAKLDYDFHIEIAKISKNSYVIKIYEIIKDVLLSAFSDIVSKRGNFAGLKYHKLIVNAFEEKNFEKAKNIMQEHMDDLVKTYINNR